MVSLNFVVEQDGTVSDPEVDVGDEPFASAAVAATKDWRFEPATLGGQSVAVRIAMEVRFTQEFVTEPPPEPALAPDEPRGDEEPPAAAEPEASGNAVAEVQVSTDVLVEGERPPGTATFSRAEARQVPGAFGDPLRAVDAMPGVNPLVSGLPLFYVRGAPPGNVGFFIDEIRLPFLYHAFLGPSVINPELVERVNLHASWYPANFGRYAGGIVEAELRAPRYERSASAGLGLWEAGAFAESPFASERGNIAVAGRYAFTGLLLSAFSPNTIEYWNYQALADYQLGARNDVRVFVLGAFDFFEDPDDQFLGTEFHRVDVRFDHHFSPRTSGYVGATLGTDRTRFSSARVVDRSVTSRARISHQATDELLLRAGASVEYDRFELGVNVREVEDSFTIQELFPARDDLVLGGFTEANWQPTEGVTVVPGIRADLFRSRGDTAVGVDPRVTARLRIDEKTDAIHSVGLSHQPPNYVPSIPGLRVAGLDGGLQEALYSTAGVERKLPKDFTGKLVLFNNNYFDLTDPFSLSQNFDLDLVTARRRSIGHSYGMELELRRPLTRRFGTMLSYTLSRSTRSFGTVHTIAGSDRTHVVNLAGMYTLGANWRLGARSVFYSGVPGRQQGEERFPHSRSAPFFRVDVRLERRFRLGPRSWWSLIAEALNATASRETLRRTCNPVCEDVVVGPIFLPNVKVEAQF